jgi:DNA-binding GntR family transcriptional regulator
VKGLLWGRGQKKPTSKLKAKEMKKSRDRIPDEVLEEIFPKKLKRFEASENVYSQLKEMILAGKFKKGEGLSYERIVQKFNVSRDVAHGVLP